MLLTRTMELAMLFSYVLLWLAHLPITRANVHKTHAEDFCRHVKEVGIYQSHTGDYCCKNRPGFFLVKSCNITQKSNETISKPCPFDSNDPANQTYIPDENNRTECIPAHGANYCKSFMNTHRVDGSKTKDSKCICDAGYFSASGTNDDRGGCHKHGPCNPGFEPDSPGTLTHNTQCEACPNGTFSNVSSVKELCHSWKNCSLNQEKNIGNSTHDTECIEHNSTVATHIGNSTSEYSGSSSETSNQGSPVGEIIVIVIVIVLFAIVIGIASYRRRKSLHKKYRNCMGHGDAPGNEIGENEDDPMILSPGPLPLPPPSPRPPPISSACLSFPSSLRPEQYPAAQSNGNPPLTDGNNETFDTSDRGNSNPEGTIRYSSLLANDTESNEEDSLQSNESISRKREESNETPSPDEQEQSTQPMLRNDERQETSIPMKILMSSDTKSSEKVSLLSREGEETSEDEQNGKVNSEEDSLQSNESISGEGQKTNKAQPPSAEQEEQSTQPIPDETQMEILMRKYFVEPEKKQIREKENFDHCCLSKALQNNDIAKEMLKTMENGEQSLKNNVMWLCRSLKLSERDIDDIENENINNIRRQCVKMISKTIETFGRKLTPKLILEQDFKEHGSVRDQLVDEFIININSCH